MKAQVADVNKVLGSVYQMCKAGNKVLFDIDAKDPTQGGYIEKKNSGSRTYMEVNQITGEFQFDLWVRKPTGSKEAPKLKTTNRFGALQSIEEENSDNSSFSRQATDPL